jgi:hypothetical protein
MVCIFRKFLKRNFRPIFCVLFSYQCCGSATFCYGSEFGSCSFRHWLSRCQHKITVFSKFFCLLLFEGTFTSVFKDIKSHKRIHKTVEIKGFLTFLLMMEESGSVKIMTDVDPVGLKTSGSTTLFQIPIRSASTSKCIVVCGFSV